MSILSVLKNSFSLSDSEKTEVRLASAPPPPPTSRIRLNDIMSPPPPPARLTSTANPERSVTGDIASEIDVIEMSDGKKLQVLERDAENRPVKTFDMQSGLESDALPELEKELDRAEVVGGAREDISSWSGQQERKVEALAGQPEHEPARVSLEDAKRDLGIAEQKLVELSPEDVVRQGARASEEIKLSQEQRRADAERIMSGTPGTNPIAEAGAREELTDLEKENESSEKRKTVREGMAQRAQLQRERARIWKEKRESLSHPLASALANEELEKIEQKLKDLGTPEKAFADRVSGSESNGLKPPSPPMGAAEGPPEHSPSAERPGGIRAPRPSFFERMSERAKSVYEALSERSKDAFGKATTYFERTLGGRAMALYHDVVRDHHQEIATRSFDRYKERQARTKQLEEKVKESKGTVRWFWYQDRLKRARINQDNAERKLREKSGLMRHHAERQNSYLRGIEDRYREKMLPFENLAGRERERHKEVNETNKVRREARDAMEERLADIRAMAKQEKGFFLSHEIKQKIREAEEKIRGIDRQISQSERELASTNARLLNAEERADTWRGKIRELHNQSQTEIPEFEMTESEERFVPNAGPAEPGHTRTAERDRGASPEEIPQPQPPASQEQVKHPAVLSFIERWNRTALDAKHRLEAGRFGRLLAEHLKVTQPPGEASLDELMTVTERALEEAGAFAGMTTRRRNKELKDRRAVVEALLG